MGFVFSTASTAETYLEVLEICRHDQVSSIFVSGAQRAIRLWSLKGFRGEQDNTVRNRDICKYCNLCTVTQNKHI